MSMDAWVAAAVFVVVYGLIAIDRWDRTLIAMAGGLLVVILGIIDQEEAFAAVDLNVIFLLVGMMVIASVLARTGLLRLARDPVGDAVPRSPDPAPADPLGRHGRRLGLHRQRDHRRPDDADHPLGRQAPGHLAGALPDRGDLRLEHRRHGDAHRRPAQHPHRLRLRARLRRLPVQPRAGRGPRVPGLRGDHVARVQAPPQGARRATRGRPRADRGEHDQGPTAHDPGADRDGRRRSSASCSTRRWVSSRRRSRWRVPWR